jgi:hypothetical protein
VLFARKFPASMLCIVVRSKSKGGGRRARLWWKTAAGTSYSRTASSVTRVHVKVTGPRVDGGSGAA